MRKKKRWWKKEIYKTQIEGQRLAGSILWQQSHLKVFPADADAAAGTALKRQ